MNRRDFIKRMRFVAAGGVAGYLCRNLGSPTPEQHLIQAEIAGDWNASPEFVDVTITKTQGPKSFGDFIIPHMKEPSKIKMYTSMDELKADGFFEQSVSGNISDLDLEEYPYD